MQDGRAEKHHQRPHPSTACHFLDGRDNRTQACLAFPPSTDHGHGCKRESGGYWIARSSRAMTAMDEIAARYTFSGALAGS
jgi:hypothetical protein